MAKKVHIWVFAQLTCQLSLHICRYDYLCADDQTSQATWYRINVRIKVLWFTGPESFVQEKIKQQPKTLSLIAWFACNWVAKRLRAAICTVEEVYRIVSASVNECLCVWGGCWLNIQGLWGNGSICFPAPKTTERNVDDEMEECSVVFQSQIAAGRHRQEVLIGNQLLEIAQSQQKTYWQKHGPNYDEFYEFYFVALTNKMTQSVQKLNSIS